MVGREGGREFRGTELGFRKERERKGGGRTGLVGLFFRTEYKM